MREWTKLGVVRTRGRHFQPTSLDAQAFVLTPGGAYGPAFLALENFMVSSATTCRTSTRFFVGNLADRIAGGGDFDAAWGDVRQLSGARHRRRSRSACKARGYAIDKFDGKAGMNTRALIGAYQEANGLKVDCWPSEALLSHLRGTAAAEKAEPASKSSLGNPLNHADGLSRPPK